MHPPYGSRPDPQDLRAPTAHEARYSMQEIDDLLDRSVANYRDHGETLRHIPLRRPGESLQVYFW